MVLNSSHCFLCGLACAEPPAEGVGPLLKTASCAPYKDLLSVLSGTYGDMNAVYEVLYEGEDEAYEIDNLINDCKSGSVQYYDV
jgi:hypothetical protein